MDICIGGNSVKIHIVQKGDTLWKLAKKYGVEFEALKKLNSQLSNPDMIMPGMKLKIPSSGKNTAPSNSNTIINVGSQKEAPITGGLVKEAPIQQTSVQMPSVKEAPIQQTPVQMPSVKEAPIQQAPVQQPSLKEAPIQQMPIPAPQAPTQQMAPVTQQPTNPIPTPVVPVMPQLTDINNHYTVNMSQMNVQQSTPQVASKPIYVVKDESPESLEKPMHVMTPAVEDVCVPITPIMPGPGFCPPIYPMYHPFPVAVQSTMIQPMVDIEESSSSMDSGYFYQSKPMPQPYGSFVPVAQVNQSYMSQPFQQTYEYPYSQGFVPVHPEKSAHSGSFSYESTSFIADESSSSHGHISQTAPAMMYQHSAPMSVPVTPYFQNQAYLVKEEEDCGCGGPKPKQQIQQQVMQMAPQYVQESMTLPYHQQVFEQDRPPGQPSQFISGNQPWTQPQMQPGMHPQQMMPGMQPGMQPQQMMPGMQPGMQPQQMTPGMQPGMKPQQMMPGMQPGMQPPHMMPGMQPGMQPQQMMPGMQPGMQPQQMMPGMQSGMQPQQMMPGMQPGMQPPQMMPGKQPGMQPQQMMPGKQPGMQPPQMMPGMLNPDMTRMQPSEEDALKMPKYADESHG